MCKISFQTLILLTAHTCTSITRLSLDICHYLTAQGLPPSSQKNSSGCNLDSVFENCQMSLAEPCRTAVDNSFHSVFTVHTCSLSLHQWWEWLKLKAVSSGPQKAPEQSKCDQKRMTVCWEKTVQVVQRVGSQLPCQVFHLWKQCHG